MTDSTTNGQIQEKYCSPEDIAKMLKVSAETVRRWYRKGDLPGFSNGGSIRFKISDVDAFIKANTKEAANG